MDDDERDDDKRDDDEPEQPGGSGTISEPDAVQRQAGSYQRDAEQDPALGRNRTGEDEGEVRGA